MSVRIILALTQIIRVLELVDRIILRFIDVNRKRSSRFSDMYLCKNLRGYSLIGKTAILHIVILGSNPNISINFFLVREAQLVERNIEAV
jgi:hypothetical protein